LVLVPFSTCCHVFQTGAYRLTFVVRLKKVKRAGNKKARFASA
jgi:hypothetical protein